uniref:Uncharacterized protein n=1 Tax=Romanomermis culicivorax TaxID=13658 RepID=A0A915IN48_ROMCU
MTVISNRTERKFPFRSATFPRLHCVPSEKASTTNLHYLS